MSGTGGNEAAPPTPGAAVPDPGRPGWDAVQALGADVWAWRSLQAPRPRDDILRMRRPPGWLPQFSAEAVARAREARDAFVTRWDAVDLTGADTAVLVDHALLGSVLQRVRWELDVLRSWQRDPSFWVDQTLGLVFDALLDPGPFDGPRVAELLYRLEAVPGLVVEAMAALEQDAERELAAIAVTMLDDVAARLAESTAALGAVVAPAAHVELVAASRAAGAALAGLAAWLTERGPQLAPLVPVGRDAFVGFMRDVALAPEPLEWMVGTARSELDRAVAMEAVATAAAAGVAAPPLPRDVAAHVAEQGAAEAQVRTWYEEKGLLGVPAWIGRYRFAPLPPWLAPLEGLGVTDDLLDPTRLGQDSVSYARDPAPGLPFFYRANMTDPRLGIAHEGVHAVQLAWSWSHEDPVRRWYYDSTANEGIAFYDEEMLLDSGLWNDAPHSRVVIARFLRLRALRVEVDVGLATGDLTIDGAAALLRDRVPLDATTAWEEAAFFAGTPGQALTYLVGKAQILSLLADVAQAQGDAFDLQVFHDRLWLEGNVPIALQRWELLGTPPPII